MERLNEIEDYIMPLISDYQEYLKNSMENNILDSEDSGFSLYLERKDDSIILIEKPSLALFYSDRVLYSQECIRVRKFMTDTLLSTEIFPRNYRNAMELLAAIKSNKITPFIGAGSSVSAGCQSWPSYLKVKAKEVGLENSDIDEYLNDLKYEELLDLIIAQPNGESFDFYFQQDFEYANPEDSFAYHLPEIFKCCVITTNFDRVIEECYAKHGQQFKEKCEGLNNPHNFIKAMTRGDHYLLKLHGNIDRPDFRVFKHTEYNFAYGSSQKQLVNMKKPIPNLLSHIYLSHSLLFLGCSLSVDRTVKTFEKLLENSNLKPKVADHYAIIEQPGEDEKFKNLEIQLQRCNIKPIWYENGCHDKIKEILLWISNNVRR